MNPISHVTNIQLIVSTPKWGKLHAYPAEAQIIEDNQQVAIIPAETKGFFTNRHINPEKIIRVETDDKAYECLGVSFLGDKSKLIYIRCKPGTPKEVTA